ncbi:MAG: DUF4115 domain-containing protein [Magnetococcales bacterium]|nr:DUF4115 domain-containing protein [Magnetococcales bacterium]
MIKKPRLNLVNRGGGNRGNKPAAAVVRKTDYHQPQFSTPAPPPPPPSEEVDVPHPPAETRPEPPVNSAENVGRLLADARRSQGRSIAELAASTRIRDIHLQALEEGAINKLPGITFVAGFMRLYAKHLNIADTDPIEAFLETLEQKRQGLQIEKFPAPTKASHRPGFFLIFLGIAALAGGFVAYERYRTPAITIPAVPSAPPLKVGSTTPEGDVFTEAGSTSSTPPAVTKAKPAPEVKETKAVAPVASPEPPPPKQKESTSFFSLWGRSSSRINPVPETTAPPPPAENEDTANRDLNVTDTAEEEDVANDLEAVTPLPMGPTAAAQPTPVLPAKVPPAATAGVPPAATTVSPTPPASAQAQNAALPPPQGPTLSATATPADAVVTPMPKIPEVAPRNRLPAQPGPTVADAKVATVDPKATTTDPKAITADPKASAPSTADAIASEIRVAQTAPVTAAASTRPPGNTKTKAREKVIDAHPVPVYNDTEAASAGPRSVALVAKELVWVQIQDKDGLVLKDMVMQPDHVFHIPEGETFYAILGSASAIQVKIGGKTLPYLGETGEVIQDLELSPEALQKRTKGL